MNVCVCALMCLFTCATVCVVCAVFVVCVCVCARSFLIFISSYNKISILTHKKTVY